jgi:Zn-dependent peptidase ImmA (M78 family)
MTEKVKLLGNIDIGAHDYEVQLKKLIHEDQSKILYGRHSVDQNVIFINEDIVLSRKYETLIHEVIHAICYNTGQDHDENMIEALANGLHQLGVGEYLWKKIQKKS